jgi:general secretion pathway protein G
MNANFKFTKGFTIIELLVVVTIIGVLATIGMVSYQAANQRARNGRREADIEQIRSALEMYRADTSTYPVGASMAALSPTYINPIPHDPMCPAGSCRTGFTDYSYSGTATTYRVTATLEPSGTYEKDNP